MEAADARAILALVALMSLPGLVIVRAPWGVVPALSLSVWITSAAVMAVTGGSRERLLHAVVASSAALAVLRFVPKTGMAALAEERERSAAAAREGSAPSDAEARGAAAALVVLATLRGAPFLLWPAPPGTADAFTAATARLFAWHDGPPVSFEPLFPLDRVGLDGAALVAGDVALLSHAGPERAVLLVALLAEGLLLLAIHAFARRAARVPPFVAAGLAAFTVGLGVARPGECAAERLAAALAVTAVGVLAGGHGRASAIASGMIAAAAVTSRPATAALVLIVLGTVARAWRGAEPTWTGLAPARVTLALATALALGWPLALRPPLPGGCGPATGLVPVALGIVVLTLARRWATHTTPTRDAQRTVLVAGSVVALAGLVLYGRIAASRIVLTRDVKVHIASLGPRGRPPDLVCLASLGEAAAWIPAVAGRGTSPALMADGRQIARGPCLPQAP